MPDIVLAAFGIGPDRLLGRGGEATVYALDDHRVLRVAHDGHDPDESRARQALVRELGAHGAPFLLPDVLGEGELGGRYYTVERRLPGRSVQHELDDLAGSARTRLIERHLDAAAALGGLHLAPRGWFGQLIGPQPVRDRSWPAYLRARATDGLRRSSPDLQEIDVTGVVADLPDVEVGAFVHLDAYAGNMLTAQGAITAVLDIGTTSIVGDSRFDPVASAIYLASPLMTPGSTARDAATARGWLRDAGLLDLLEPVRHWLAAFWAFATDDPAVHAWCRSVLLVDQQDGSRTTPG